MRDRTAIALRLRSVMAIVLASIFGMAAFLWPLLTSSTSLFARSTYAPFVFALVLPLVLAVVFAEMRDGGMDVKAVAMLGVLSAIGAVLRPMGAGSAGIETVFVVLILGGRVYGPGFGFALGTTTMLSSALLTGGVGPWLPFQMIAASWVGMGAGLLPRARARRELIVLMCYGACAGLVFGVLMNLTFWPLAAGLDTKLSFVAGDAMAANLHRFLLFSVGTSLGWDIGRALTNVALIALLGPVMLGALRRSARLAVFLPTVTAEQNYSGSR